MSVEFLDGSGTWQPLQNATAVCTEPGVYEITLHALSHRWLVSMDLFDGSTLRVDGQVTKEVVGILREKDRVVLKALTDLIPA